MNTSTKLCLYIILFTLFVIGGVSAQDSAKPVIYEYASVRFDGEKTCIVWQDGSVDRVTSLIGTKDYEPADKRIWYLTVAFNIMSKRGFEPSFFDNTDMTMVRSSAKTKPKREYAAVRFTGQNTSIVWPDGKVDKVSALSQQKTYEPADIRMWYLTEAMNLMGKKGFKPVRVEQDVFWRMDPVAVWMVRDLTE